MMIYFALIAAFTVAGLLTLRHALETLKSVYFVIGLICMCAAAAILVGYVFNTSPVSDLLNYEARQTPYYQDAVDGTPSAMLAYCDNGPRYFGDCLARLELVATVTAQARLDR